MSGFWENCTSSIPCLCYDGYHICYRWVTLLMKAAWLWWDRLLCRAHFCFNGLDDDIHFVCGRENRWAALAEQSLTKCKYSTLLWMYLRLFWLFLLFACTLIEPTPHWWTISSFYFSFDMLESRHLWISLHRMDNWRQHCTLPVFVFQIWSIQFR